MNIKIIRRYMLQNINSRVIVKYHGSRNKKERFIGNIYKVYNNIFTIKLDSGDIKSFSFRDILTKTIQIYI